MDQLISSSRRRHRPLNIRVRVFECSDDDKEIRKREIDIANGAYKDWIYDLILWATLNGKAVEIINVIDDKD